jgi:hypothetical protein
VQLGVELNHSQTREGIVEQMTSDRVRSHLRETRRRTHSHGDSARHQFSKVKCIRALYSTYTRALTFHNFPLGLLLAGKAPGVMQSIRRWRLRQTRTWAAAVRGRAVV